MGGGGVMRTLAKVAVISLGVLRGGVPGLPPAEQSFVKASQPFSAMISSSKGGSGAGLARLVFGGPPSLEEAKVATTELTDAVQQVYFSSPKSTVSGGSFGVVPVSKYAMEALTMLRVPKVQSVLASLACDQNFWNAFWQNEAVMEFFQSLKTTASCPEKNPNLKESVEDSDVPDLDSPNKFNEFSVASRFRKLIDWLMGYLQNTKPTVVDMVHKMFDSPSNIFGLFSAGANGNSSSTSVDRTPEACLMSLAVAVIMVVLLKRV